MTKLQTTVAKTQVQPKKPLLDQTVDPPVQNNCPRVSAPQTMRLQICMLWFLQIYRNLGFQCESHLYVITVCWVDPRVFRRGARWLDEPIMEHCHACTRSTSINRESSFPVSGSSYPWDPLDSPLTWTFRCEWGLNLPYPSSQRGPGRDI